MNGEENQHEIEQEKGSRRKIYGVIQERCYHEDIEQNNPAQIIKDRHPLKQWMAYISVASLCMGIGIGSSLSFMKPFGEAYYHKKYATKLHNRKNNIIEASNDVNQEKQIVPYDNGVVPPELDGSIVSIAKNIGPCIVSILNNRKMSLNDTNGYYPDAFSGGMIIGLGSGVIFDQDDENYYIITNNHVIDGADSLAVNFVGDIKSEAKLVGKDSMTDLAIIRVEKIKLSQEVMDTLAIAPLGNSDRLEVGQLAVAIGTPATEALSNTVTTGIISGVGREITLSGNKMEVIQTSAAINSGNSGGALVGPTGEVIGINVAKTVDTEGIGFAIPINQVKVVVTELMVNGSIERPALGITGMEITSSQSVKYDLPIGIFIQTVLTGGSADLAGVKAGDILIQFEGTTIMTMAQLKELIAKKQLGDIVEIKVLRGEETKHFKIELKTMPES